jgi:hypothetical protein
MTFRRTTIAALIVAAAGATTLATATLADNANGPADANRPGLQQGPGGDRAMGPGQRFDEARRSFKMRFGPDGANAGRPGMLLNLACSDRGAEALEIAFVHLSYRLDLTADQQKLFDTLRTDALASQSSFADQCKAAMPDSSAAARPDFLQRMKDRLTIQQARLDAMTRLMPDVEAFYASLSDDQKARLMPGASGRGQRPMLGRMEGPAEAPQSPAAPAAPAPAAPALNG